MSEENSRTIHPATWSIPLATVGVILAAALSGYIWLQGRFDCMSRQIQELGTKIDRIGDTAWTVNDQRWYTKMVAKLNPNHPIPDIDAIRDRNFTLAAPPEKNEVVP